MIFTTIIFNYCFIYFLIAYNKFWNHGWCPHGLLTVSHVCTCEGICVPMYANPKWIRALNLMPSWKYYETTKWPLKYLKRRDAWWNLLKEIVTSRVVDIRCWQRKSSIVPTDSHRQNFREVVHLAIVALALDGARNNFQFRWCFSHSA